MRGSFFYLAQMNTGFGVFTIGIKGVYYTDNYVVVHKLIDNRTEHFIVQRGSEKLLISSNRPFFRNRGLKKRKPDYKLEEGERNNMSIIYKIIEAIHDHVLKKEASAPK